MAQRLSSEECSQFERDGVLKLEGLLDAATVERARQAVLRPLEALGLWRDGAWLLEDCTKPHWPDTGLKPGRDIGHRRPEVEALIEDARVSAAVTSILGDTPFDRTLYPRPQILVSLPNVGPWRLPGGWHTDLPRLASGERPGLQAFFVLEAVGPKGGATLAVAGSHRLLNDGRNLRVKDITAALRTEPFFRSILNASREEAVQADLPTGRVRDIALQVVEFTGDPGDVWLMDLRLLHSASPNSADRPRMMATYRYLRAALTPQVAAAFGWK
jgi:ectoine hydroxylase-related dioxygenase (phytanoyl-CoA dioxygenase family)